MSAPTLASSLPDAAGDTRTTTGLRTFLDGRYGWARDLVRDLADDPLFAPATGLDTPAHREHTHRQVAALAGTDVPRLLFPRAYGGLGNLGGAITAFETAGFGDLSLLIKQGVQFGLFGGAIQALGTADHHERYLRDVMTYRLPGCFAMTEAGHGSDVQSLRTTAEFDPASGEFVVHTPDEHARKEYIGNAAVHGRMAVVFAQLRTLGTDRGVHAFMVPLRDDDGPLPGITIGDCGQKAGLNGVDNGHITFDHVHVPRSALLDRFGAVAPDGTYTSPITSDGKRFFTMLGTLVKGRVSISGAAVSAAKVAHVVAVRHALERRQFRAPGEETEVRLLDYRAHQRRLLPGLATTYALHFAQEALVEELDRSSTDPTWAERDQRKLESRTAGLKALTTWHASDVIQTAREACGGAGYLSANRLPQLRADTDVFTTFEGDNTVLMQLVAKGLLTDHRDDVGNLDALRTVRFVADQFLTAVVERTAAARMVVQALVEAVPGRDDDADLRERGFQLELIEWRERHVLDGLVRRMRAASREGVRSFDVVNDMQDHLLLAAHVHMERIVVEDFVAAVARCPDPETRDVLDRLLDLHVLALLERDRAWFMEHGRFSAQRARATTALVNAACADLRPMAGELVESFGVPQAFVAADIAPAPSATD